MKIIFVILLTVFAVPYVAGATFIITEVHYDPEGSDKGMEWIEVQNTGPVAQDLREYFFRESGVSHRIASEKYGLIEPGGFAVIADKPENVEINGPIFDSSFSLINTGEELSIISPEGTVADTLTYSPLVGGAGDGSTYSYSGSEFAAGEPTPGSAHAPFKPSIETDVNDVSPKDVEKDELEEESVPTQIIVQEDPEPKQKPLEVNAGGARTILAGVPYTFKTIEQKNVSHVWNFGDGAKEKGESVSKTYEFPGEYVVSLKGRSSKSEGESQAIVSVVEPSFSLEVATSSITIGNETPHMILIEDFEIHHASSTFVFPEGSYLRPKRSIAIPPAILNFSIQPSEQVSFISPTGTILTEDNMVISLLEQQIQESQESKVASDLAASSAEISLAKDTESKPVPTLPTSPTKPFITPLVAEASEQEPGQSPITTFEILLVSAAAILALLYVGHTYTRNRSASKHDDFQNINL